MSSLNPEELYTLLLNAYGPQGWWPLYGRRGEPGFDGRGYRTRQSPVALSPRDSFEIFLGAVLTQNTNWRNVERALERLFEAGIDSPESLLQTDQDRLAEIIRPSGYFRQKSRRLLSLVPLLFNPDGPIELPREKLLAMKGIGPETADSILLYVYGRCSFIADLYTRRLQMRLVGGDTLGKYEEVRSCFESRLPNSLLIYRELHGLIIRHGKEHCAARPRCTACPLAAVCRYANEDDA